MNTTNPTFDRSQSLQDLEGVNWGDASPNDFGLEQRCKRLRRVPLEQLEAGDLRLLISQNIGLDYVVPLTLEILADEPLTDAGFYMGDLLASLLHADSKFWVTHPEHRQQASSILAEAMAELPALEVRDQDIARECVTTSADIFQRAEYFAQHGRG